MNKRSYVCERPPYYATTKTFFIFIYVYENLCMWTHIIVSFRVCLTLYDIFSVNKRAAASSTTHITIPNLSQMENVISEHKQRKGHLCTDCFKPEMIYIQADNAKREKFAYGRVRL